MTATRQSAARSVEECQDGLDMGPREWCKAPELFLGQHIEPEVDCWAFGVVLIWMITGRVCVKHVSLL